MLRLRIAALALASAGLLAAVAAPSYAGEVDLPRSPSISPDGETIVFSWHGDLWAVSADGGEAGRLTNHAGWDQRSTWSPDGRTIAFESNRSGSWNLHVMGADGSDLRQVTHEDTSCSLAGFTPDGSELTFASRRENDVYSEPRPYRIAVAGGPIRRVHDAHGRFPRLAPSRSDLLFTRGGSSWSRRHYRGPADRDVWLLADGEFQRLTTWEGNDGRARWAGDGRALFLSDRELDTVNLWSLDVSSPGNAQRLTSFDGRDVRAYDVASKTGRIVLHVWDRLWVMDTGGTPRALSITAPADAIDATFVKNASRDVSEARLSPDGKVLAVVAFGDVFVRAVEDDAPTRRVTADAARAKDIAWSPDGMRLFFVSDADGTDSIYAASVERTRGEILEAFEQATNPPEEEPVEEPGDTDDQAEDGDTAEEEPQDEAAADDEDPESGKDEDGEKKNAKEKDDEDPGPARWQDAVTFTIEPVLAVGTNDREPRPSPDGKHLAFRRGRGHLAVLDLASAAAGESDVLIVAPGWNLGSFRWSPDSRRLAWSREDRDFNSDIWITDADGSTLPAVNVSRHPDDDVNPRWSADGRVMAFASERHDEQYDVYVVFLDRDLEQMTPAERAEYFEERGKAVKKMKPLPPPVAEKGEDDEEEKGKKKDAAQQDADEIELELDDAYLRVRRVTTAEGNEWSVELLPAGDRIVYSAGSELRSIGWDGKDDKKLRGAASIQHLSLDGGKVVYVAGGQAGTVKSSGGGDETHGIDAPLEIDWAAFQEQRFREAMRLLGEVFYHPTMKGLDWRALTADYLELARRARTSSEFDDVANRQLGELNASHLRIRSPSPDDAPSGVPNGRLGIDVVPDETIPGAWRVTTVLRDGPAGGGSMWLLVGDVITAIDGEPCRPGREFLPHLRGKTGEEVLLTVLRPRETEEPQEITLLLRAISGGAERQLLYEQWTRENAESVHEWSDGRLGYLHIRAMSGGSLRSFERDLYAAAEGRDGLIVDVRNNGGGSTADRVLASIMVRPHAYTVPRGADPEVTDGYPQDRLFIQRYTRPMSMLCNEKSFSNAEIVSHAFKTLDRGTLVGEQTYGGVISTGGYRLLDGTWVRTPFRGWYLPDGTDMENNGAMPDLHVPQTPEDEARGEDAQLRAAVSELLERLER